MSQGQDTTARVTVRRSPEGRGKLPVYLLGFGLSLACTLLAYAAVTRHLFSYRGVVAAVVALALAQFVAQLVCFLHLGREAKPRWKLGVFLFMIMVVVIIVGGSLWIMRNLNYRMTPMQQSQYLRNQDGL